MFALPRLTPITLASGLLALAALFLPPATQAVLEIKITKSIEGAQPIAIVPFGWQGPEQGPPVRIGQVVADNLARTGRFEPYPFADLPSRPTNQDEVNFTDWRLLGSSNLVIGSVEAADDGTYRVRFRLYDVFRAQQLAGYEFTPSTEEVRRIAHQISDVIYERLTGERGAFDTQIAYVTEQRLPANERLYSLNIADSDGFDAEPIVKSKVPVMSPAWAPDGRRIAYVSYEENRSQIFVQDLISGRREKVAAYPGINGAPAWSPDGTRLAMTLSKDGNAEIYILDMRNGRLQRLTKNTAIDTEPAWSPDGRSLVFTSDRGGRPQIYRIPASGGRTERLTYEGTYNARATYSPDGTKIAFIHGADGAYRTAVLDLENGALDVLTRTRLDESPTFAPNGVMILYATVDSGAATLAAVSTDGRVRQELVEQQRGMVMVREPAWSPFRKP